MAQKRNAWEWLGLIVAGTGGAITMVASFFLAGEERYPGLFYIQRQALWDHGQYGVNLTFLLTWFTLLNLVVIPMLGVAGLVSLLRRMNAAPPPAPPGWDVQLSAYRIKTALLGLVLLPIWAAVTGIVVLSPEWFSPLGGLASVLLLIVPTLPMIGPALLFEAAIPPSYVEGAIESLRYVKYKNRTTVHLHVAGRSYTSHPSLAQGLTEGARVGLISTGFSKKVRQLARLG